MSHYYEDFATGGVHESRGRTVTEADIVNFAGLSGDFVELHTNDEFARKSPFGQTHRARRAGLQHLHWADDPDEPDQRHRAGVLWHR